MGKPELVLSLDPTKELVFRGPFTHAIVEQLKLSNPTDKDVAYKVKTTAPKSYSVRPSSGLLHSHGSVAIKVTLQPFEYNPEEKLRHRFMIQAGYPRQGIDLDTFWSTVPGNEVMESRLKSVLDMPGSLAKVKKEDTASIATERAQPSPVPTLPVQSAVPATQASPVKAPSSPRVAASTTTGEASSELRHRSVGDSRPQPLAAAPVPTAQTTAKSSDLKGNILLVTLVIAVVFVAILQFLYR